VGHGGMHRRCCDAAAPKGQTLLGLIQSGAQPHAEPLAGFSGFIVPATLFTLAFLPGDAGVPASSSYRLRFGPI
jgi:hypothetical protein